MLPHLRGVALNPEPSTKSSTSGLLSGLKLHESKLFGGVNECGLGVVLGVGDM